MSQSVVLIGPTSTTLETLHRLLADEPGCSMVYPTAGLEQLNIEDHRGGGVSYLTINELGPLEDVRQDYATNDELNEQFREEIGDKAFHLVTFNDIGLGRRVVRRLLSAAAERARDLWIDNGYDVVIRGDVALARLTEDPDWDWCSVLPGQCAGD
ncbi:MAG: hypothetical protein ACXWLB_08225 [Reyranella sp.]